MFRFEQQDLAVRLTGKRVLKRWMTDVLHARGMRVGEINIILVSDDSILEINRNSLGHDYYTDIITFDYSEGDIVSGDLFISLDTVLANSTTYRQPYTPHFECELCRVMIHGLLHMSGEDDMTTSARKRMRKAENDALKLLSLSLAEGAVKCTFHKKEVSCL